MKKVLIILLVVIISLLFIFGLYHLRIKLLDQDFKEKISTAMKYANESNFLEAENTCDSIKYSSLVCYNTILALYRAKLALGENVTLSNEFCEKIDIKNYNLPPFVFIERKSYENDIIAIQETCYQNVSN